MVNFYKGIKEDFAWKPRFETVVKDGEHYDGMAYGFYWLRFGISLILLRAKTHPFLLEDDPKGWL